MVVTAPNPEVKIPLNGVMHDGILVIPEQAQGIVLFAHGSGSSRLSPRNTYVASILHQANIATLMFDLLTEAEDRVYARRFDIALLTQRLIGATLWVQEQAQLQALPLGYFGASTGAAAALQAAAKLSDKVRAVVSRGGRPDLAGDALPGVRAATLLIVGGADTQVIELNQMAYARLETTKKLEIVPGATHLFEEPGTLEQVASLAARWFQQYLTVK